MESIFGIPITEILVAVVAIMAVCLASTVLIAVRNRVVFRLAVRNVPRRRMQSILIMTGLMLSTAITTAALVTGDTLDSSLTSSTYAALGEVDEVVAFADSADGESDLTVTSPTFPAAAVVEELEQRLGKDSGIDALMPVFTIGAPVVNPATGLSEPVTVVTGLDPARTRAFGGLRTAGRREVDLAALPVGATVISKELADAIGAREGEPVTFYVRGEPHVVTVAAVVPGSILTGYLPTKGRAGPGSLTSNNLLGIAVPLAWLQAVTGMEGEARFIAVSNAGGVASGVGGTGAAVDALRAALAGINGASTLGVSPIKADTLDSAEAFGSTFTALFLVFGLFSVAAGVLLILLIFTMLAAERRSEMGIARAIGMTRSELVQGFLVEGTVCDLGAAFIGATVGVLLSIVMTQLLGSLFGDVSITPAVTAQSLVVAYALGVSVTFITVIVAAVRASRMTIVAAIRDLPDGGGGEREERPRWHWWKHLPFLQGPALAAVRIPVELAWNAVSFLPRLSGWLVTLASHVVGGSVLTTVLGALVLTAGVATQVRFLFALGLSLLFLGLATFLRRFLPARPVFTVAAAIMLLYWALPVDVTDAILPPLDDGGPEMLFVAGAFMVTYTTLILMWNVNLIVRLTSLLGRSSSRWVPAVRAAVAYPLAAKGRTGLTIAMFSLVIFSAVTVRTINANFVALLLGDDADAGWDITVTASPSNPVGDLKQALNAAGANTEDLAAVGRLDVVMGSRGQVRNARGDAWARYPVNGMDVGFIEESRAPLEARAPGYESDAAAWEAIRSGEKVAVIDGNAFDPGGFGGDPDSYRIPASIRVDGGRIPAFDVELQDPRTGRTETVTVIGVINRKVSILSGLFVADDLFTQTYGSPDEQRFYVRQAPSSTLDDEAAAARIEGASQNLGVQAVSIRADLKERQSQAEGFFTLMQGFLGLGLLVGIAALGVISFRSVVERRQQIGVLRAIGFERSMVSAAFIIESLVTAVLGVISGAVLAIVLSYNLVMGGALEEGAEFERFVIPWDTIVLFVVVSLVAAVVMTWLPARKAAAVPIAEALRYE